MEEKRASMAMNPPSVPFVFSLLKNIFLNNNGSILRMILTTVGFRIVSPFLAQRVWGLFFKTKG